jgi:hypothetical protein
MALPSEGQHKDMKGYGALKKKKMPYLQQDRICLCSLHQMVFHRYIVYLACIYLLRSQITIYINISLLAHKQWTVHNPLCQRSSRLPGHGVPLGV